MEYEVIEVQGSGLIVADEMISEDRQDLPLIPVSSTYVYREGAVDSPYIVTCSTY